MPVQNYGRIIAGEIDDSNGLLLRYGCTGSADSILGAGGAGLSLQGGEYSGGQILPQDGQVLIDDVPFRNISFGPGQIYGVSMTFYEGVAFAPGAQPFFWEG